MIAPYIPYDQKVTIKKEDWSMWAEMIRSEQIPSNDLVELFNDNPQFAEWYYKCFTTPR